MKKQYRTISLVLSLVIIVSSIICISASAIESDGDVLPCGHVRTEWFADSDECVQCYEARLIAEAKQGGDLPSPYALLCPKCGRSAVVIKCMNSKIVKSENYAPGPSQACLGCTAKSCKSSCYTLRYKSYAKYVCYASGCNYSSVVFDSTGSRLTQHYCNLYDYCNGETYNMCDLSGDIPTYPNPTYIPDP